VSTTTARLTNGAYGYPTRGAARRMKPRRLLCLHITGNRSNLGPSAAKAERDYANRKGSMGPSAHDYIDRNGHRVAAIYADKYAAWSNGGLNRPNTAVPGVTAVAALPAKGFNPNEDYYREVECVGYPGTAPITAPQLEVVAQLLAADSKRTGLTISRATVHCHADLDTVDRQNCPFPPATREKQVAALIARAKAILAPPVVPPPPPPELEVVKAQLASAQAEVVALRTDLAIANRKITAAKAALA
jgi:hypothetical protein